MGKHVLDFSAALLLCGVILVAGVAPVQSWSAEASTPDTLVNGTASGGRYRLAGGAAVPGGPAAECSLARETAPEAPDPAADGGEFSAWAMARGDGWQAAGSASGGGYRLTGLAPDQLQGGAWQVRGGAGGGRYRLEAPTAVSSYVGSGCCCTYLPGILGP
jgi:hypothetical protein